MGDLVDAVRLYGRALHLGLDRPDVQAVERRDGSVHQHAPRPQRRDPRRGLQRDGHQGEISKVGFNPPGNKIITASSDRTCRVWDVENGDNLQVLEGHTDEIFSAAFNYEGDTIITGSKDNTCRVWKC